LNVGQNIIVGVHFVIMAKGKLIKTLKRKKDINWHLFMKIKEIRRKGR